MHGQVSESGLWSPRGLEVPRGLGMALYRHAQKAGVENAIESFRSMSPLTDNAERLVDDAVIKVGRNRLTFVSDLIDAVPKPVPNWLSVLTMYQEKLGEAGSAKRSMVPKARGERQVRDRSSYTVPIYSTWDDFSYNVRELLAAERAGTPLDTDGIEMATRNVNEAIEDAGINGGPTVGGNASPGVLAAPNVNTQAYISNEAWTAAGHSGQDILDDVINMATQLRTANYYGPYTLYVNTAYGNELNKNFGDGVTTFDMTIRKRLQALEFGSTTLRVREADQLPTDRTVLMQLTTDVVDVVVGQSPVPLMWEDGAGLESFWLILACIVPRFKSDSASQSGICTGDLT